MQASVPAWPGGTTDNRSVGPPTRWPLIPATSPASRHGWIAAGDAPEIVAPPEQQPDRDPSGTLPRQARSGFVTGSVEADQGPLQSRGASTGSRRRPWRPQPAVRGSGGGDVGHELGQLGGSPEGAQDDGQLRTSPGWLPALPGRPGRPAARPLGRYPHTSRPAGVRLIIGQGITKGVAANVVVAMDVASWADALFGVSTDSLGRRHNALVPGQLLAAS